MVMKRQFGSIRDMSAVVCFAAMLAIPAGEEARALPLNGAATIAGASDNLIEIRARGGGGGRRGGAVAVRRGPGGRVHGAAVVRPGVRPGYRPGYRPGGIAVVTRPGAWARPYRWAPGGAIAAGAAIGVISAAAASSYGYRAPQPGLCWYYTDASRRNGF
ncbi:MAG: hypothetical protein JWL62_1423 [Hyphomicrobiales bacterium]|nr:hypothetical protein [Hyphomicrobiales bacterium]